MENMSINYYINKYKQLEFGKKYDSNIRIALLSSFTMKGLKQAFIVKCSEFNIKADVYECDYGQYAQDILNKQSNLYLFNPDIIILFIDLQSLIGDTYFIPNSIDDEERKKTVNNKILWIEKLIGVIKQTLNSKIVIHNFEVPIYSPLGIIDNKQDFGFVESVEYINFHLRNLFKKDSQVYLFNYDMFCSRIGKEHILDHKMYYLADMKLKLQLIPCLCDEYIKYIKSMLGIIRKCIVLDLDNTLWGGIIGETDIKNIKLGPTFQEKPFYEFQKYLLALNKKGVILAINSKNNYDDAMNVIKNHPYMILREENFASIKINWNNKVENLKQIAEEINIGLDSIVFIDDDRFNIDMVKSSIPQIRSILLPEDPALYVDVLKSLDEFNNLQITEEDLNKSKQYFEQKKRNELKQKVTDINDFLRMLEINVEIRIDNIEDSSRISQLTQKTNQFNLTTRRYLEEDIQYFINSKSHMVLSIKVKDKFGDNGITAVAIINKEKNKWILYTFLLSCRIIGKNIEDVIIGEIIKLAQQEGVEFIIGEFIPTKKNKLVENLYAKYNFKLIRNSDEKTIWEYNFNKDIQVPKYIKTIIKRSEN